MQEGLPRQGLKVYVGLTHAFASAHTCTYFCKLQVMSLSYLILAGLDSSMIRRCRGKGASSRCPKPQSTGVRKATTGKRTRQQTRDSAATSSAATTSETWAAMVSCATPMSTSSMRRLMAEGKVAKRSTHFSKRENVKNCSIWRCQDDHVISFTQVCSFGCFENIRSSFWMLFAFSFSVLRETTPH